MNELKPREKDSDRVKLILTEIKFPFFSLWSLPKFSHNACVTLVPTAKFRNT